MDKEIKKDVRCVPPHTTYFLNNYIKNLIFDGVPVHMSKDTC